MTFEHVHFVKFHFHHSVFPQNTGLGIKILFIKLELYCMLASKKKKSIPNWHLFITQMETKWTKWYAMTWHVIAYRSLELLFGTHTFHFNSFFEDFNWVFTQIRCLSRVLIIIGILLLYRLPIPRPGEVLGLVGTNGIGKSTALKILAGKQKPNLGRYSVSPRLNEIMNY